MDNPSDPFAWVDWLIAEREKSGMSQADLARKSGLTRATISDYERRIRTQPDVRALSKISRALGYAEDHLPRLAGLLPLEEAEDPWVEKMSYRLGRLSPGLREVAERFINSMLEGEEEEAAKSPKQKSRRRSAKI